MEDHSQQASALSSPFVPAQLIGMVWNKQSPAPRPQRITLDQSLVDESWQAIHSFLPPSVNPSADGKENLVLENAAGEGVRRHQDGGDNDVKNDVWEAIQENAVRAHRAREIDAGNTGRDCIVNQSPSSVLSSVNINPTASSLNDPRSIISAEPHPTNQKQNGSQRRHIHRIPKSLPLPRTRNDRLICERKRHLIETWVETQRKRVGEQQEVQRVLMRAPAAFERGQVVRVVRAQRQGVGAEQAGPPAKKDDQEPGPPGSIVDQPVASPLPVATPRVPPSPDVRPSPPPASTASAPQSITTEHRNRRKRGRKPGKRAKDAEVDVGGEQREVEMVVEMNTANQPEPLSNDIPDKVAASESLEAEKRQESGLGDIADGATRSGSPKVDTHREPAVVKAPHNISILASTAAETPSEALSAKVPTNISVSGSKKAEDPHESVPTFVSSNIPVRGSKEAEERRESMLLDIPVDVANPDRRKLRAVLDQSRAPSRTT